MSKELSFKENSPLCAANAFSLAAGGIKVMDLIYCPFGRMCSSCDKRRAYTLTDETGRKFALKRYETSLCRFELYNCANIFSERGSFGGLYDFTLLDAEGLSRDISNSAALKSKLGDITRGHSNSPVL